MSNTTKRPTKPSQGWAIEGISHIDLVGEFLRRA